MVRSITQSTREKQIKALCEGTLYSFVRWEGQYKSGKSKFVCSCSLHGQWVVSSETFVNAGTRCATCSVERSKKEYTTPVHIRESQILERCKETGYKFLSWETFYENNESFMKMYCSLHGDFVIKFSKYVSSKQGCKKCGRQRQIKSATTPQEVRMKAITETCQQKGYEFIEWVNFTGKCQDKLRIECKNHGEWLVSVSHFLNHKNGCPSCCNGGFKSNKAGCLYLLVSECSGYLKVGITNTLARRIRELQFNTPFHFKVLEVKNFEKGEDAKKWEQVFHSHFKSAQMSSFDGATEWLKWDSEITRWFHFI